jgi:hypothetical protein
MLAKQLGRNGPLRHRNTWRAGTGGGGGTAAARSSVATQMAPVPRDRDLGSVATLRVLAADQVAFPCIYLLLYKPLAWLAGGGNVADYCWHRGRVMLCMSSCCVG